MNGRKWTAEEDELLRNSFPYEDTMLVIEKLGRSYHSVLSRVKTLKIRKTKEAYDKARRETYKREGKEINKLPVHEVPIEKAYMNEEWLRQHYLGEKMTSREIGAKTGVDKTTVLTWMNNYEIPTRVHEISEETRVKLTAAARKRCGPKSSRWKGGRTINNNGYRYISVPDHPNANSNGYVFEHRVVMEFMLGRLLKKGEIVHHRDFNRLNNVTTNLFLFPDHSSHAMFHQYKRYNDPAINEEEFMNSIFRMRAT